MRSICSAAPTTKGFPPPGLTWHFLRVISCNHGCTLCVTFSETGLLEVMTVDGYQPRRSLCLGPVSFGLQQKHFPQWLTHWHYPLSQWPSHPPPPGTTLRDLDLGDKGEQLIEFLLPPLLLLLKAREIIMMAAGRSQNWLWPGASEQVWAAGAALKSGEQMRKEDPFLVFVYLGYSPPPQQKAGKHADHRALFFLSCLQLFDLFL